MRRALAGRMVAVERPAPPNFSLSQELQRAACAMTLYPQGLKPWHNSHGLVFWNRATWCLCSHQQRASEIIALEHTPLKRKSKKTHLDFNLQPKYWKQKQYYLSPRSYVCCVSIYAVYINLSCKGVLLMLQLFLTICMSLLKKVNLEVAGWRLHLSSSAQAPLKYTSSQALSSVIRGIQREQPAWCCMICIKPITHPAKLSHFNVREPKPLLYWPRVFPGALNPPGTVPHHRW